MGILKCQKIDFNNPILVDSILKSISELLHDKSLYHPLKFKPQSYFEIPNGHLPSERGWYIILHDNKPVYVGQADNLNSRLNSNNGSIDNFANSGRSSDSQRNFIKKFNELEILGNLKVCIIKECDLCHKIEINTNELSDLDRDNIEKFINIFRSYFPLDASGI